MIPFIHNSIDYFTSLILIFSLLLMFSYLIMAIISIREESDYLKETSFINYKVLLASPLAPSMTLIAPAYNEEKNIKHSVHSLLALDYANYEIIVVNDGSTDSTLDILINSYSLEKVQINYTEQLKTQPVKAIYKSKNLAFSKLTVIDKHNGAGKADASNAGLNLAKNQYIVCLDADGILHIDSLLIFAKPLLERLKTKMVAVGGVIRIANNCVVKDGHLIKVNVPNKLLPRMQVQEYLRAFLLGRMAWSNLDGLLLISGALGLLDKEIAIKAGGYSVKTVGEDMEIIVRMRRYMLQTKQKYVVSYIPNPMCWTEGPDKLSVLVSQRSRWTRGTMETLWAHKKMIFNPKYKILGLLSMPYWFFFEYLSPLIEAVGILITIYLAISGTLSWQFVLLFFLFAYSFAILFSLVSLFADEFTFNQYPKIKDLNKLLVGILIEPIIFHPITVYSALVGNWQKLTGKKGWGTMIKGGFDVEK